MDLAQLHAALAAADELPYGRERIARREELVAGAERLGDPAALASALLSLADDCQEDGDERGQHAGRRHPPAGTPHTAPSHLSTPLTLTGKTSSATYPGGRALRAAW